MKETLKTIIMKFTTLLLFLAIPLHSFSQDKPAYKIFTEEGKKADYDDIIKQAKKADVIFFGELHDNPVAHWLELELTKDLFAIQGTSLVLAAEMFETDNQLIINEYLAGIIKETSFESEVKKWNNYGTDYKPLVNFAKEKKLKFVASNIPRRYASIIASGGFEALAKLSPDALRYIAPVPFAYDAELPCYKDMLSMGGGAMHASENLPKAQAAKDATMAKSIADNWSEGLKLIHYNGSYHSDRHQGIIWHLNKYNPSIKVITITTVLQDTITKLDSAGRGQADFVIAIPNSMTRTYK
jgi:uncharacterized iron-regulated protein